MKCRPPVGYEQHVPLNCARLPHTVTAMSDALKNDERSNGRSVRTVLESLTVAGIIGLFALLWGIKGDMSAAREDAAASKASFSTQLKSMNEEIRSLRTQLSDIPTIAQQLGKVQVQIDEHERRLNRLEEGRNKRGTRP